jgi:hypothetical protein
MRIPLLAGKAILDSGKVSCICCVAAFELAVKYSWIGTDQFDLDTKTTFLSESVGYECGGSGTYVSWLPGGSGMEDDQSQNGFERVDVRVDQAKTDLLWTSSVNIELFAGWYIPAGGSGLAEVIVEYNGVTASKTITPGSQSNCAATPVGTVTVYADGTFDLV